MNIQQLISLHEQAIQTLKNIQQNNQAIKNTQDRCVMIEKGNEFVGSMKRDFINEFHSIIDQTRAIKANNVEQYAELTKRIVQPVIDRMMLVDNGVVTELIVSETIVSNLLK
jgi:hypothetical protein